MELRGRRREFTRVKSRSLGLCYAPKAPRPFSENPAKRRFAEGTAFWRPTTPLGQGDFLGMTTSMRRPNGLFHVRNPASQRFHAGLRCVVPSGLIRNCVSSLAPAKSRSLGRHHPCARKGDACRGPRRRGDLGMTVETHTQQRRVGHPQNQGPDAGRKPFEAPFGKLRAGRTGRRYEKETADPRQNRPGGPRARLALRRS